MAIKFEPTVSLGNVLAAISFIGAVAIAWGNLQSTLARQDAEISQLKLDAARLEAANANSRVEMRDLLKEVKSDLKEVKLVLDNYTRRKP